jgi:hypothetical protein
MTSKGLIQTESKSGAKRIYVKEILFFYFFIKDTSLFWLTLAIFSPPQCRSSGLLPFSSLLTSKRTSLVHAYLLDTTSPTWREGKNRRHHGEESGTLSCRPTISVLHFRRSMHVTVLRKTVSQLIFFHRWCLSRYIYFNQNVSQSLSNLLKEFFNSTDFAGILDHCTLEQTRFCCFYYWVIFTVKNGFCLWHVFLSPGGDNYCLWSETLETKIRDKKPYQRTIL